MISPLEIAFGLALMLGLMFIGLHVATTMLVVALLGATAHFGLPAFNALGVRQVSEIHFWFVTAWRARIEICGAAAL